MMQISLKTMLISLAALVAASAAVPAVARDGDAPVLTLVLPGGAVEPIQGSGLMPPQVFFAPALAIDPTFAALDRMEVALDRRAELMLRQAASLPTPTQAMLAGLPQGASSYTVVSTFSSNGVCTRSTQVSYSVGGAAPRTVSSTSGDCGPTPSLTTPARDTTPNGERIVPAVWER
jgi:hypothetical protein